jgi:hypothetical protein
MTTRSDPEPLSARLRTTVVTAAEAAGRIDYLEDEVERLRCANVALRAELRRYEERERERVAAQFAETEDVST